MMWIQTDRQTDRQFHTYKQDARLTVGSDAGEHNRRSSLAATTHRVVTGSPCS